MPKAKYHHVYITKFISFRCCSLLSIPFSEPPFPWSRGTEALIWERDWSSVGIHPWRMCGTLRDRDDRDLFLAFSLAVKIIRRGYQAFIQVVLHDVFFNPNQNGGP